MAHAVLCVLALPLEPMSHAVPCVLASTLGPMSHVVPCLLGLTRGTVEPAFVGIHDFLNPHPWI